MWQHNINEQVNLQRSKGNSNPVLLCYLAKCQGNGVSFHLERTGMSSKLISVLLRTMGCRCHSLNKNPEGQLHYKQLKCGWAADSLLILRAESTDGQGLRRRCLAGMGAAGTSPD